MSRIPLLPLLALVCTPFLSPIEGVAQVTLPVRVNRATGEFFEPYHAVRYRAWLEDRRRDGQIARTEKLLHFRERNASYAADACGLGCEGHEGIQVRGIPGTDLAAVLYKTFRDDGALTVQLRFHNDGSERARLTLDPTGLPESFYVQIGANRWSILTDEEGELETKGRLDEMLAPGEIESWWARFPAPRSATAFDLYIPGVVFRDVPLEND